MAPPLVTLAIGVAVVLVSILWLRINAFFGLIAAALIVSFLAPGSPGEKASRVAEAFGNTAGGIGIAIVLAAVIGACLVASGAADRIVRASLALFGEKNGAAAMAASGFVLSVPVFFDTVFYLLFPLVRSMHRRTGRHYLRYLLAIGAGAAVTHTMVPPTPGPLLMAEELGVDIGVMMLAGIVVSLPMSLSGMAFAAWRDRTLTLTNPPLVAEATDDDPDEASCPGLLLSLAPIVLPAVLIAMGPISQTLTPEGSEPPAWLVAASDKNLALFAAAIAAVLVYVRQRRPSRAETSALVEGALVSAGAIVLITAAGGAFGAMLKQAEVGPAIRDLFASESQGTGFGLLWLAFSVASLIKTAQGSTTVALITASGMVGAMSEGVALGFHPAYLCTAIGSGAMITSWMNDSGFWIFCRMGGLTEREGMQTWTPIMIVMGAAGMAATLALATVFPGV